MKFTAANQTGNPQMPAWEIDQSYDGVNQPLKRIETRRIETLVGGGPQTTITTVTETTLYVRSSLLGGQIVYELDESGNRRRANIYGIGGLLARGAISGGTDEFRWRVGDPVTGIRAVIQSINNHGIGRALTKETSADRFSASKSSTAPNP